MYLHANLVLLSVITDIENEVCVFESCIYDYFKLIEKSKDPDHTRNSFYRIQSSIPTSTEKIVWKSLKVTPTLIILQEFDTLVN